MTALDPSQTMSRIASLIRGEQLGEARRLLLKLARQEPGNRNVMSVLAQVESLLSRGAASEPTSQRSSTPQPQGSKADVGQRVRATIARFLNREDLTLPDSAPLLGGLIQDSLDYVELMMDLEAEFHCPNEVEAQFYTVGDAVSYFSQHGQR